MSVANVAFHRTPVSESSAWDARSSLSAKEPFVGTWRLVSWKIEQAGGELIDTSLGRDPTGWIMYHWDGRMSVALMRSDRPRFASNNLMEATPEEMKSGFEGYVSYCGSYAVNAQEGFVIHHLELSSFPNLIGTDQKRYYEFWKDRLTLKSPPLTLLGRDQVHRLVWERLTVVAPNVRF